MAQDLTAGVAMPEGRIRPPGAPPEKPNPKGALLESIGGLQWGGFTEALPIAIWTGWNRRRHVWVASTRCSTDEAISTTFPRPLCHEC